MTIALRNTPGDNFLSDFKYPAHEMFHIAQGLVAGSGDLELGHSIVLANYGTSISATGSTRFDLVRPTQMPYELAAEAFSDRLLKRLYP